MIKGWVGIDLDGTLAKYDLWRGIRHIGEPIAPIQQYVKSLLKAGVTVKIFTARCQEGEEAINVIKAWCIVHLGEEVEVTDRKDMGMVFLVDDRAVSVEKNTGKFLVAVPMRDVIDAHTDPNTPGHPEYQETQ